MVDAEVNRMSTGKSIYYLGKSPSATAHNVSLCQELSLCNSFDEMVRPLQAMAEHMLYSHSSLNLLKEKKRVAASTMLHNKDGSQPC